MNSHARKYIADDQPGQAENNTELTSPPFQKPLPPDAGFIAPVQDDVVPVEETEADDPFVEGTATRIDLFNALDWALIQDITPASKVVLIGLTRVAHPKGYCWPFQERIAEQTGLCVRQVRRATKELIDKGLITRSRRGRWRKSYEYTIAFYRDRLPAQRLAGF